MTGQQRDPTAARATRARTRDTLRATQAAQARFARKYRLRRPIPLSACAIEWLHTGRRWTHPARVTLPLLEYPLGDHLRGWRAEETGRRPYAVVTECYLSPAVALAEAQRIAAACCLRAELLPLADTVHRAACPEVAAGCAVVSFTRAADRPLSERWERR